MFARVFRGLRVIGLTFIAVFYTIANQLLLFFILVNGFATSDVLNRGPRPVVRLTDAVPERGAQQRAGDGQCGFSTSLAELMPDHSADNTTGNRCDIRARPVVAAVDRFRPALGDRVCHCNRFILWLCLDDPGLVNKSIP